MALLDWLWLIFIFAFGCCVGSFLNVVVYRLPRDKSLVRPGSSCPSCGALIRFYDNVPLLSWLALGAKCRRCKAPISPRYFVIELLTGAVFAGLFVAYFHTDLRPSIPVFLEGGWYVYVLHIILLGSLIAASAIDLELWVIPISVCWFATFLGLAGSAIGGFIIDPNVIDQRAILPSAGAGTGSLAAGALIGLGISLLLVATGVIKRSYESEGDDWSVDSPRDSAGPAGDSTAQGEQSAEQQLNHRREICREIVFLLPIVACSVGGYLMCKMAPSIHAWWVDFSQRPFVAGLLGSLWGYFVGCGVVWVTRILGTLGFGKEAMGLGDVHLMGAAGATIGPLFVVVAFFVAPFFGLLWAGSQMLFRKTRQIPYGPFLSLGILTVMILHDRIFSYWNFIRFH
ncbi:MAG TPA: prepilin peptidase [Sedimentisphaerales bacterium]|nr:prepilin peptidase [Sedimentisphaerales bacterium]